MSDPLAVVPLAVAASGGNIDHVESVSAVAAGLTLLQRCAPLVRHLTGSRPSVLLPNGAAFATALAACEGHTARLLPHDQPDVVTELLRDDNEPAVFTITSLAHLVPSPAMTILLDDAPHSALVRWQDGERRVDLGAHFGIELEGERDALGRDEIAVYFGSSIAHATHRDLLARARHVRDKKQLTPVDRVHAAAPFSRQLGFVAGLLAPLLAGASVTTTRSEHTTVIVAEANVLESLMESLTSNVRLVLTEQGSMDESFRDRWLQMARVEIRELALFD